MGFFNRAPRKVGIRISGLPRCGSCGLYRTCDTPKMPVSGRGVRKILFVAEAPGETEDKMGTQLVGEAGQVLRRLLYDLDVDLDDCWKTNAVICHPPRNRMSQNYIDACRPNVFEAISTLKPNVVILLGASAVESVIGGELGKSVDLRPYLGQTIPSPLCGAWLCPTYHPSFLLRLDDKALETVIKTHLKSALALEHTPPRWLDIAGLKEAVRVLTNKDEVKGYLEFLAGAEGMMAFDFETTGLKPERPEHRIFSCAFSTDGKGAVACLMHDSLLPCLRKVVTNPRTRKIAANLKFEERWCRQKLGVGAVNWYWDTMLTSHILYNQPGVTGLKFQTYVQFGVPDYSSRVEPYLQAKESNAVNSIDKAPLQDLLVYNGLDALLEYRLAEVQWKKPWNGGV